MISTPSEQYLVLHGQPEELLAITKIVGGYLKLKLPIRITQAQRQYKQRKKWHLSLLHVLNFPKVL
jgi:hypothetical protein